MKLEFSRQISEKSSDLMKFDENPCSGSRVVPCGRTDGQIGGQTDMTILTVAFRSVVNLPKNGVRGELLLISIKALMSCVAVKRRQEYTHGPDNAHSPGAEFLH